jgi:hypothetical protein
MRLESFVHRWRVIVMVEVEVGLNFRIGKVEQGHMIISDFEQTLGFGHNFKLPTTTATPREPP